MPIQLIRDEFSIDSLEALVVKAADDVVPAMQQIDRHLKSKQDGLLRVRLDSQALWLRFKHYEGCHGVLPTVQLVPRLILAQQWDVRLPDWLSDALIIRLGLLQKTFVAPETAEQFADSVLRACIPDLWVADYQHFIAALGRQGMGLDVLLQVAPINEAFCQHLISVLGFDAKSAQWFVGEWLKVQHPAAFLAHFAYQQHLEHLRGFISAHQLNLALPPKTAGAALLQALPVMPLPEDQANGLVDKYLLALDVIERKIHHQEVSPEALADWLVDWPSLLEAIGEWVTGRREWLTSALLAKLQLFGSEQAQTLAADLQKCLDGYPLLADTATVEDAIKWSEGYFDYCRVAFMDKHPLDEAINRSFTDWLLAAQSARVSRSKHDWRQFSGKVKAYLRQGYVAVIIMVDALSALNQDKVLQVLQGMEGLILLHEPLFAPLPTLTEIGKMAVLTGLPVEQQPSGNQEAILRHVYQEFLPTPAALKVLKSWADSNEHIDEATQLLVYFENRLDERLHDCPSFSKHRDDILPIISQIKRMLGSWKKDAALLNKDIVFFVTADHGMTVTQSLYSGQALGDYKERAYKLKGATFLPDDFALLGDYAVPKHRCKLTADALLAHGGLTPEEVLIPCITLSSKPPQVGVTPLDIKLQNNGCVRVADRCWQLEMQLITDDKDLTAIEINLPPPFAGKCSVDSLRAYKNQSLTLRFSAGEEQEGLTEIEVLLSYQYAGACEEVHKRLTVKFPALLLEKDVGAQNFEDMF